MRTRLEKIVQDELGLTRPVRNEDAFKEDLGMDSVELFIAIEDEFDIEIPDAVGATLKTFGDALAYMEAAR